MHGWIDAWMDWWIDWLIDAWIDWLIEWTGLDWTGLDWTGLDTRLHLENMFMNRIVFLYYCVRTVCHMAQSTTPPCFHLFALFNNWLLIVRMLLQFSFLLVLVSGEVGTDVNVLSSNYFLIVFIFFLINNNKKIKAIVEN